jgi:rubredoxin
MNANRFERTALDLPAPAGARMECGVCWQIYDPGQGDPVWQIAAGTAFSDLPLHWTCPHCDAPRHKFLLVDE